MVVVFFIIMVVFIQQMYIYNTNKPCLSLYIIYLSKQCA